MHLAAGASEFWAALCPVSEYVMQHVCSSTSMGHAILDESFGGWQPWELDIKGPMSPSFFRRLFDTPYIVVELVLLGQEEINTLGRFYRPSCDAAFDRTTSPTVQIDIPGRARQAC